MAKPFLKRKSGQALLIVGGVIAVVYSYQGWRELGQMTQTRAVDREIGAALEGSRSQPAGIPQMEEFLRRLKRIDTGGAPREVADAVAEYVAALDAALDAYRGGKSLEPYDQAMEKAQKRVAAAVKEHSY